MCSLEIKKLSSLSLRRLKIQSPFKIHAKDKIVELSQSQLNHKYYTRFILYPRLPVQFKSKKWTWKIARQVLSEYLENEGFGKGSNKHYGRIEDEPDHWPDTIGWVGFNIS